MGGSNRLLLITDNEGDAAFLRASLAAGRVAPETLCANSLDHAVAALRASAVDAILLDITLCKGHPADALRRLCEAAADTPVLIIAGSSDLPATREALRHGAQDYMLWSSFNGDALAHRLQFCIERFRQERETRHRLKEVEKLTRRFESLVLDNADAILVLNRSGRVKFANPAAGRLFNRDPARLIGSDPGIPVERGDAMEIVLGRRHGSDTVVDVRIIKTIWDGDPVLVATLRDISLRKHAERSLMLAKQEAELANETKSRFLAHMSHELRTPLNSILGFTEMMQRGLFGDIGNNRYADYLETIRYSGAHLLTLINNLLDLSKIEAGREELDEEIFDIRGLLSAAAHAEQPTARAHGLTLVYDAAAPAQLLRADRVKLDQIILNLLSNAIKFTPDGGRVTLCGRLAAAGGYEIVVADNGCGMDQDEIPQAMGSFAQIRNPYTRKGDRGTGLGLPIARSLAELHQGALEIASRRGFGTRVILRLPAERLVQPPSGARLPAAADGRNRCAP
ncbi:MAG: ATP-binding protein [Kiloniellaceae bacterium]